MPVSKDRINNACKEKPPPSNESSRSSLPNTQFREDEIITLEQLRDEKVVKNSHAKIGGRLRLAHEENDQLSITTEIIKYDENLAVVKAVTSTMKGNFPGLGMASADRDHSIAEEIEYRDWSESSGCELKQFDC